jgi:hypothetical protein
VNDSATAPLPHASLAAVLRAEPVAWNALGLSRDELLDACAAQNVTELVHQRLCEHGDRSDWPADVRDAFARLGYAAAARELLRQRSIVSVLGALASAAIRPILLKGTPLAYSVYDVPSTRPRGDTDLFIPPDQVEACRLTMTALGYVTVVKCDGEHLFHQFEFGKTDDFGLDHAFDFHWKISTQSVFADLLSYDELAADAVDVPALGPHARAPGPPHALLVACVHPVMHHRNAATLLWIYDIHLLVSRLAAADLDCFIDLAIVKKVAAITAQQLGLARSLFDTPIPDSALARLRASAMSEASAAYLRPNRRWRDELASNIHGLPHWQGRIRLLREVLFPGRSYMVQSYGLTRGALGTAALPALYLHRIVSGLWKVLLGRK